MNESETWQTDDLGLAAYLVVSGFQIKAYDWHTPFECWFVFAKTEDLLDRVSVFSTNEATCDPKELMETFSRVKRTMLAARPRQRTKRR